MPSLAIASISAACIFGGAVLGMALGRFLPADHLSDASRDTVKVGAGILSLMAALVLGLLISSAKGNFDATNEASSTRSSRMIFAPWPRASRSCGRRSTRRLRA